MDTKVSGPRRYCSPHMRRPQGTRQGRLAGADPHPTAANLAIHVGDAAVALRGAVELADLPHTEALRELLPDSRPQPVTHSQAHAVPPLDVANRLPQQVAAYLTDVLHYLREEAAQFPSNQKRGSEMGLAWPERPAEEAP